MRIERVDVRRLEIPLTRPYRLSFGPVTRYDTIVVEIVGDEGQRGFGEATLLTGYTDETIGESYALACEIGRECREWTRRRLRADAGARRARAVRRDGVSHGARHGGAHPLLSPPRARARADPRPAAGRRRSGSSRQIRPAAGGRLSNRQGQGRLRRRRRPRGCSRDPARRRRSRGDARRCEPGLHRRRSGDVDREARSGRHRALRAAVRRRGLGRASQGGDSGGAHGPSADAGRVDLRRRATSSARPTSARARSSR